MTSEETAVLLDIDNSEFGKKLSAVTTMMSALNSHCLTASERLRIVDNIKKASLKAAHNGFYWIAYDLSRFERDDDHKGFPVPNKVDKELVAMLEHLGYSKIDYMHYVSMLKSTCTPCYTWSQLYFWEKVWYSGQLPPCLYTHYGYEVSHYSRNKDS